MKMICLFEPEAEMETKDEASNMENVVLTIPRSNCSVFALLKFARGFVLR